MTTNFCNFLFDLEDNVTKRRYENMEMAVNLESLIPLIHSQGYTDMSRQPRRHDSNVEPAHTYKEISDQPEYELPN